MFGIISKRRFVKEAIKIYLENDTSNAFGVTPELRKNDFYYRSGNANALNCISSRLGIDLTSYIKKQEFEKNTRQL